MPADAGELHDKLRDALNWPRPLPPGVVARAASDGIYLAMLIGARNEPETLASLVHDAPSAHAPPPTSPALVLRAVRALGRWASAGFTLLDDEARNRRIAACRACPNLGRPGGALAHRLVMDESASICGLCGCPVDRKAALPTETCGAEDPASPGLDRWGEPLGDAGV